MAEDYTSTISTPTAFSNVQEAPLALGRSPREWVQLLDSNEAKATKKALDYYDGKQLHQMLLVLEDVQSGRKKWRERGMLPRFRNLTKMIVSKSGMLFKDSPPKFEVYIDDDETPDEAQTQALQDALWDLEWNEFCQNLDEITRLCKTSLVLTQYDQDEEVLVFDILTRANSCALVEPGSKDISGLIYVVSAHPEAQCYRVLTDEFIYDLRQEKNQVTVTDTKPNPFGEVTCSPFYDTNIPRSGLWVDFDNDLVQLNEMYNLSLVDSEYCIAWQKKPTLFTNMKPSDQNNASVETVMIGANKLPRQAASSPEILSGPGSMVLMDSAGVDQAFLKFDGPNVDILPLDKVVEGWVHSFANDWSVRIKVTGEGSSSASSGFQVIVEEMDNMELRKVRQRMFENGFKRLFREIKCVFSVVKPGTFSEDAELAVQFNEPYLPVELKTQEEVWSLRIKEGRATEIDYFIQVLGLTKVEAEEKFAEIQAFNAAKKAGPAESDAGEKLSTEKEDLDPTDEPVMASEAVASTADKDPGFDTGKHLYPVKTNSQGDY